MLCERMVFVLKVSYGKQWWLNKYVCIPDHVQLNNMDEMGDYYVPKGYAHEAEIAQWLLCLA